MALKISSQTSVPALRQRVRQAPDDEVTQKAPPPKPTDISEPTARDLRVVSESFDHPSSLPLAAALISPSTDRLQTDVSALPRTETASGIERGSPLSVRLQQVTQTPTTDLKAVLKKRRTVVKGLRKRVSAFANASLQPEIRAKKSEVAALHKEKRSLETTIEKTKAKQERNRIFGALLGGFDGAFIMDQFTNADDALATFQKNRQVISKKSESLTHELAPLEDNLERLQADLAQLSSAESALAPKFGGWLQRAKSPVDELGVAIASLDSVTDALERQVTTLADIANAEGEISSTLSALIDALKSEVVALKRERSVATDALFLAAVDVVAAAGRPPGDRLTEGFPVEARVLTGETSGALQSKILAVADQALGDAPDVTRQRVIDRLVALMDRPHRGGS